MGLPLARLDEQYEIVAKIKEGGMGEIYKVRHRLLDEIRVVKVLHPQLVGDQELTERFAREARAAIALRHPNIVQIFDFTVDQSGTGLIVMEFIRGTDLKQLIGQPQLPSVALTLEIARQGLRALGYLHRNGFVHRDVSPDNLMLSSDVEGRPLVKVIDLGIAKRRGSGSDPQLTASGIFLGKFRYASPEHFGAHGKGGIEARSDLYTFGLVLYELLTGRYPIQGESMSQLIAGHLFQPPHGFTETDPDRRIPEALRAVVLKTLAKEPSERFASADELIAQLERLQAEYPVGDETMEESRRFMVATPTKPGPSGEPAPPAAAPSVESAESADSAELETLIEEVEDLLRSGQLMEADRILFQAREAHGPAPELTTARERLDELYQRGVESEVRLLLARAETLGREDDFAQAFEVLEKARAVTADSPLRQRVEAVAASLERGRGERRRAAELEQGMLAMIQRQDFAGAREVLTAARTELGSDPAFESLRRLLARTVAERVDELVQSAGVAFEAERFEEAATCLDQALDLDSDNTWIQDRLRKARGEQRRREDEVRRRVERDAAASSHLRQAREARDARDVLKARLLVAKALELRPDDSEAVALGRMLDRQHRADELSSLKTAPLSAGLMQAYTDIEARRAEGDVLAAWRLLRDAIEEFGEIDTFTRLRRQIAEEILNAGEQVVDD